MTNAMQDRKQLVGFVNPVGLVPAFLIPVFATSRRANEYFAQHITSEEKIGAFEQGAEIDEGFVPYDGELHKGVGDQAVYAIDLGGNNPPLFGERSTLVPQVRGRARLFYDKPLFRLCLLDFCGRKHGIDIARKNAFAAICERAGIGAAAAWAASQIITPEIFRSCPGASVRVEYVLPHQIAGLNASAQTIEAIKFVVTSSSAPLKRKPRVRPFRISYSPPTQSTALFEEIISLEKVARASTRQFLSYERTNDDPAAAWRAVVAQLTKGGRQLLERLAWFTANPIPLWLCDMPVPGVDGSAREALAELVERSLVSKEGEQFVVNWPAQNLASSRQSALPPPEIKDALAWINGVFQGDPENGKVWERLRPLIPHAREIANSAYSFGIAEPSARILNEIGLLLTGNGQFADAEEFLRQAVEIADSRRGDPNVAVFLSNLSTLLSRVSRHQEALVLVERALQIDEKSLGDSHPNVAIRLNNKAQVLQDLARYDEAEPLLRRALEIDQQHGDVTRTNIGVRLNNLARLYHLTNRLDDAERLFRRAVEEAAHVYGDTDPKMALRLNNLGALLRDRRDFDEAEKSFKQALKIDLDFYGIDNPRVAQTLGNLAQVMQDRGQFMEALPLAQRAQAINERYFGRNDPKVANDMNTVAHSLHAVGSTDSARDLFEEALAIDERILGPDHPNVARDLNNLASILHDAGDFVRALELSKRNVEILLNHVRRTGRDHIHLRSALAHHSTHLRAGGRSDAEIASIMGSFEAIVPTKTANLP